MSRGHSSKKSESYDRQFPPVASGGFAEYEFGSSAVLAQKGCPRPKSVCKVATNSHILNFLGFPAVCHRDVCDIICGIRAKQTEGMYSCAIYIIILSSYH